MAVNVVRYQKSGENPGWGVLRDEEILPVEGDFATTGEFITGGAALARKIASGKGGKTVKTGDVEILSPVTRNQHYICQGMNYRSHLQEIGMNPDEVGFNTIFTKASSCIVPAGSEVVRPKQVKLLDYEVELGLVIGREITSPVQVTDANLHEFVAALVITNDISARDVQIPQVQFHKGKSYRTFGPTGPVLCLIDRDDVARIPQMRLTLSVNGENRQNALAADMIFKPAETVTELSEVMDLFPGDLIATGTPGGVALTIPKGAAGRVVAKAMNLIPDETRWKLFIQSQLRVKRYLKPGDRIESRIRTDDGSIDLGRQANTVIQGS